jgi:hypothetical protein
LGSQKRPGTSVLYSPALSTTFQNISNIFSFMNNTEPQVRPHRVLLTNDDGITAPGLIAMITHVWENILAIRLNFLVAHFRAAAEARSL